MLFVYIVLVALFLSTPVSQLRAETYIMSTADADIVFDGSLSGVAREVAAEYPAITSELRSAFGWEVRFRPEIVLVRDRHAFREIAGSDIIVAYAVPGRNLIVLDTSRIYGKPFSLEATLKHETCHLLLHSYIKHEGLPRWLDEGTCQWASGGIAELFSGDAENMLAKAGISGSLIDIQRLESFPSDERSLVLAYQESKSMVEYIASRFGSGGLIALLERMHGGDTVREALWRTFSVGLPELEKDWRSSIRAKHTWFMYLSDNIYTVIFSFAAVLTLYGFVRLVNKRRAYRDEDDEDGEGGPGPAV